MNRYITFVMYLALHISYCWTFGTQNRDECNYSYIKVPANSTCNIMEGGLATIGCEAIGICNTFTVLWFKHTIEDRIIINGSEYGSKYQVLTTVTQTIADCRCSIGTTLIIHRFNHSDNGYYSCQIVLTVSDNSHLLQSSPSRHVAVGEIMNERSCTIEKRLSTPICAEDPTSTISQEMQCTSESLSSAIKITSIVTKELHSTHIIYSIHSTIPVKNLVTSISPETPFDRQQNMVWVYGLITVFVLVIIVLVLSLVLVSIKRRTQQKATSNSLRSKSGLAQEEVLNTHYIKTSLADNNACANNEEVSTLSNTQSQTSENEEQSQSAETAKESNTGDMYQFASYSQDKTIDYSHEPPGYAALSTAKYGDLRIENSVQNSLIGDEWFSPGYDEVGGHELASKTVVMVKEQEDPSPYIEPQQRCPSPVYAEVHKDKKKKQQQDCLVVVTEEREGNQSPEYSQVENVNKHSVNQKNHWQEDEQHYYHSLENPVEHGNKEVVYTIKHSQEPQVVSIQSTFYESPDPDVTNIHTKIADSDSEVNTFPNPCYHTQMHTAD